MASSNDNPLGQKVSIPDRVDPSVLFGIERAQGHARAFSSGNAVAFLGLDTWNCYEFAWLGADSRPHIAVCRIVIPADSPRIVESKSLKLYLGGFYATRFESQAAVCATLQADIGATVGSSVEVALIDATGHSDLAPRPAETAAIDLDQYPVDPLDVNAIASSLQKHVVEERFRTAAFRSLCPVTGQPDWAEIDLHYRGSRIEPRVVAGYLASFRNHGAFHEDVCEQIFLDLSRAAEPEYVLVQCNFLRRGGIDINPLRYSSNYPYPVQFSRRLRQ